MAISFINRACILLINLLFINNISIIASEQAPVSDVYNGGRGTSFNVDWKFQLGDVSGAESPTYNDASWRALSVPHDWSIELPFNKNSAAAGDAAYLDGGIGWYRKTFYLPQRDAGKRITIQFEGIYMYGRRSFE